MGMEQAGQVVHIKSDPVRLVRRRRLLDDARKQGDRAHDGLLALILQQRQVGIRQSGGRKIIVRKRQSRLAQHRFRPRMGVLHVEDRVVLRLFDHLGQIELQLGVVLAEQHHEADGVDADLVHDIAQRDELAGALRHLDRLARSHQFDQLAQLDVERGRAAGDGRHRRLHPLDVAAMVGAPDVDHPGEAARELGGVVGDVAGEIGVGAVRFEQRTIDIVAEARGAEQRLLAVLPVLHLRALGRRQAALVDEAARAQIADDPRHRVAERALGDEHVVRDAERGEIPADHRHHRVDGPLPDKRQPFGLRPACKAGTELRRQRRAGRLEIVAGVEPLGDGDRLAQRLAVAQEGGAGEHVHLRAGIVDVVFARHPRTGKGEQVAQGVAEHRAAAVADMHRPGRIGGDELDVDLLTAGPGTAEIDALRQACAENIAKHLRLELDVDEARPGDLGLRHVLHLRQPPGEFRGELARVGVGRLDVAGEHHRGIGGEIAMGGIARQLDGKARHIQPGGKAAGLHHLPQEFGDSGMKLREDVHLARGLARRSPSALLQSGACVKIGDKFRSRMFDAAFGGGAASFCAKQHKERTC